MTYPILSTKSKTAESRSFDLRMLKVLLATPLPPPNHGGIANWTRIVRKELGTRSNVELLFVDTAARYRAATNRSLWLRLVGGSAQAIRDTYRVYRRLKVDRPHVFHLNTSAGPATLKDILMLRIARWFRVPSVIHYRMGRAPYMVTKERLHWRLIRCAMAQASVVVTLDKRSEAKVKEALPQQRVVTLPNMVELDVIDDIRSQGDLLPELPAAATRIVFVGLVGTRKGVPELVEACTRLSGHSLILDLVGPVSPGMKRDLQKIASRTGTTEWLRFHGSVDHQTALRYMLSADVFVFPSHGESAPNVILEAMGCGRAIVSTTVAAIPEMLDYRGSKECGVCIEAGDVEELASGIKRLLEAPDRAEELGRTARQRAEKLYAVPAASDKLLKLWKSIAKGVHDPACGCEE